MPRFKQDGFEVLDATSATMLSANPYGANGANSRKKKRGKGCLVFITLLLILVAAIGVAGYFLYGSAMSVKAEASEVMSEISTLKKQIKSAEMEEASATAHRIAELSAEMHEQTSTELWEFASYIPYFGSDIRSVRTLAESADVLSQEVLIPLTDVLVATPLDTLMVDGGINIEAVMNLVNELNTVAPVASERIDAILALPEAHLGQVNRPLEKAKRQLAPLAEYLDVASDLAGVLPELLGANGQTQTYLIVACSNAEARASVGFPGSWGTLTITDGRLELGDFDSIQHIEWPSEENRPAMSEEERLIFGDALTIVPGNSTMTPDFPRSAELMSWWWQWVTGMEVAGVIAVDPVYLQTILSVVGGVTTSWGRVVDGSNAAALLMHDAYQTIYGDYQDGFFAEVAGEAFHRLTGGLGDIGMKGLLKLIKNARETHHLQIWFRNPQAQQAMEILGLSGALETDPAEPVMGVYWNDETWGKLSWFMDVYTTIGEPVQNADGTVSYQVTTTVTNTLASDQVWDQVQYILGYSPSRRYDGDLVTNIYLVAPYGGSIEVTSAEGPSIDPWRFGTLLEHDVAATMVKNGPGETTTIVYTVTVSAEASEELQIRQTPLGQSFGH